MQRTSQTVHGSAEGQVGVREGTTHQVAGVGTDVAPFMVTVTLQNNNCESEHVNGATFKTKAIFLKQPEINVLSEIILVFTTFQH